MTSDRVNFSFGIHLSLVSARKFGLRKMVTTPK